MIYCGAVSVEEESKEKWRPAKYGRAVSVEVKSDEEIPEGSMKVVEPQTGPFMADIVLITPQIKKA
jgi:hypothetical protein